MLAFSCRCNDLETLPLRRNGETEYSLAPCGEGIPVADEPARTGGTIGFGGDFELDRSKEGMGMRSQRYSMLVDDGVVKALNVEQPGQFDVSSAEAMLKAL